MKRLVKKDRSVLRGIWLNPEQVTTPIEHLLLQMIEPNQPDPDLRQAVVEELNRKAKRKRVALQYLNLKEVDQERDATVTLYVVAPHQAQNPWQKNLLSPQNDCPIGFVLNSCDAGRIVLIHDVFRQLTPKQQALIRKYAALAIRGMRHDRILTVLSRDAGAGDHHREIMLAARRRVQSLSPSILFSHNGAIRVQVGSISQTTKNIIREGIQGDYLFILPRHLFEGKTNYADVEFIVYLNFFLGQGKRTRIIGTVKQGEMLRRLLTLTIFGIFSPQDTEQPSFAELRRTYGVPDRDTLAFLRMCYEKYSVRKDFKPDGVILGLDDYIDFVPLNEAGQPTRISIRSQDEGVVSSGTSTVRILSHHNGAFDVRITQANGESTDKQLVVTPPQRALRAVPDELCRAIQFATDRPRFGVTPLGTSDGFDPVGDLTSFVLWVNGTGILVDPSPEALDYLAQIGVAQTDLVYVFLTHIHADHDGGLIEKLLSGSSTTVIASDVVFKSFVQKAQIVTGHDFQKEWLVRHLSANPGRPILMEIAGETVELETRWNLHPIPTNGFKMTIDGQRFGYAGDTQYDPDLIRQLQREQKLSPRQVEDLLYFLWTPDGIPKVDLLYHEAGMPPIHTDKYQIERLPEAVKARTAIVHIASHNVPSGFVPNKPPLLATHTLLPATPQSRKTTLLRALGLVSYLYDMPLETLAGLLDRGTIKIFHPDDVIIRAGPVKQGENLAFFILIDGEVVVKDGRRLITRLGKADSFGEWGISHQRSFRAVDVLALRRAQLLELDESAYRWLIAKHPVIQERIARIRVLLPRLQLAQARAIKQTEDDPQRTRSVIEDMNTSQLATFAVFSVVKTFKQGMPIVVEGEAADGFYILLSGHLTVTSGGKAVDELSEGDVFGEIGLIEKTQRMATVEVTSADAEVLFMSRKNFQRLLQTVPAFSFNIRDTVAQRRLTETPA